jgi:HSP20 family protein
MRTLMPWTGMPGAREMDRLLNRFLEEKLQEESSAGAEWAPSMDVSETKDSLIAKLEVPGMDPKDIQISLQENLLTIKGEKTQEQDEKEEHFHRVERTYGMFARSVRLPVTVDASKVAASFKNGLLTITLPKTPTSRGTTIPIKAE